MPSLTVSNNEMTDASRTLGIQGDGRTSPDSSFGIWESSTNLITNGGFETNTSSATAAASVITRDTTWAKFGTASLQVVT